MSEDSWDQARLIPTSSIPAPGVDGADSAEGADEQQRRAASALLAVVGAVREFGRAVIQPLGAPAGAIETFIEVSFDLAGQECRPDGLIRVRRGRRTWTALVEVRTGSAGPDATRLGTYLEIAHERGLDAVLTISNEIPGIAGRPPVAVDPQKLRDVRLHHYSWSHLLMQAMVLRDRGLSGQEHAWDHPGRGQVWVLGELIRYLDHPWSGTMGSLDQGSAQIVRGVEITSQEAPAALPEPREPVLEVDLREPQITVLHTVVIAERAVRMPPTLPSRREVRLVRQLGANTGEQAGVRNVAGWYQDPEDAGQLRWWDGVGWSERTYPAQPALA